MNKRLYFIFNQMKQRCYNPKNKRYKNYGGRGIKICDEWLNNPNLFFEWALANGYNYTLTIDRIDCNKGYEPNNCRWVTQKFQQNNRTNNRIITYKGKSQTLSQWCEELGIPYSKMKHRVNEMHWSIEKAFETKNNPREVVVSYKNKTQSISDWCKEIGIPYWKLQQRLKRGWTVERAFETQ